MCPKDVDGMVNSVDPDQTAPPKEQSDVGLHCLLRPICPNTYNFYGISLFFKKGRYTSLHPILIDKVQSTTDTNKHIISTTSHLLLRRCR